MNGFNLSDIQDAKLGGTSLSTIYFGTNKLWPLHLQSEYFWIKNISNSSLKLTTELIGSMSDITYEYSNDTINWTPVTLSGSDAAVTHTLLSNQKMYFRGNNSAYAMSNTKYFHFNSTGKINVGGNIMSLLYGNNFRCKTSLPLYAFCGLFKSCSSLVSAGDLILPATTLANHCYANMFENCTSLTTAPSTLTASSTSGWCCYYMFNGCTSLTTAPELPATTLTRACYYGMFKGCTSLTTAPELPATTLAMNCYTYMFENCPITSISLPATTLANSCYANMLPYTKITSLELPAIDISSYDSCYRTICYGCTELKTVTIRATSALPSKCLEYAFYNCSKLNNIKAMFTSNIGSGYTSSWVKNVAPTGTFTKNSAASWSTTYGVSNVPNNWTVQTTNS